MVILLALFFFPQSGLLDYPRSYGLQMNFKTFFYCSVKNGVAVLMGVALVYKLFL